MKVLINFADQKFRFSQQMNTLTAKHIGGFDKVIEYSPEDIDDDFYQKNKQILDIKRGAGLWLWKPYFILKTLQTLNEGDMLIYCDSGAVFSKNINHLCREMDSEGLSIFLSFVPLRLTQWMRKEVFVALDADNGDYHNSFQPWAGFIILRKNGESLKFIEEWLRLCTDYDLIRDAYPNEINHPGFIEHRHDQSLLNVLSVRYKLANYKDVSHLGSKPFIEAFLKFNQNRQDYSSFKGGYPTTVLLYRKGLVKFLLSYCAKKVLYKVNKNLYYRAVKEKNRL